MAHQSSTLKIGFAGIPGSGKTSTARAFAGLCGTETALKRVELVHEYAREHIAEYGPIETLADQYAVSMRQVEWEDRAVMASIDAMVTDSPIFLGWLYAMYMDRDTKKDSMYAANLFTRMCDLNVPRRYDIVFHLPPVVVPVDDNIRVAQHLDDSWRKEADALIPFIFKLFPPKRFVVVKSATILERVEECLGYLKEYFNSV